MSYVHFHIVQPFRCYWTYSLLTVFKIRNNIVLNISVYKFIFILVPENGFLEVKLWRSGLFLLGDVEFKGQQ